MLTAICRATFTMVFCSTPPESVKFPSVSRNSGASVVSLPSRCPCPVVRVTAFCKCTLVSLSVSSVPPWRLRSLPMLSWIPVTSRRAPAPEAKLRSPCRVKSCSRASVPEPASTNPCGGTDRGFFSVRVRSSSRARVASSPSWNVCRVDSEAPATRSCPPSESAADTATVSSSMSCRCNSLLP